MRQRGFSLIELIVTITVLALVLLAAAPAIGTWTDNTRIRNAAEALQGGLEIARKEAVARNEVISFYLVSLNDPNVMDNTCALSGSAGSWVVSAISPATKCASAPSTTTAPRIVAKRAIGDSGGRVKVTGLQSDGTTAGTTVTFNGFGRVANADPIAWIDVTGVNDDTTYRKLRVMISGAGGVRMCDPQVTDSNDPRKC